MGRLCFVLCCVLMGVVDNAVLRDDLYRLDVVHFNDFHDRFEETSVLYPVCKTNDDQCLGGFARLYGKIMELLKEKPNGILLNAGDVFQGTYWYTLLKWEVEQKFINLLPIDAHAIGNHEFDDGASDLVKYLAALRAPVVAANMDTTKDPNFKGLYKPHVVLEKKGRKIGIIGLITTDTALISNSDSVTFLDPVEAAKKEAQILTDQGVDIIIVLSHCGLDEDIKMARRVGENIDLIVGGHSHSLLWNGDPPSNETKSGPYPVLIEAENKPGHKVVVVQASSFSKYLGDISLYFDKNGDMQTFVENPVFLNRTVPEDPEIKAMMQPYKDQLSGIVSEVVGFVKEDLLATPCGGEECALGDLVADSFLTTVNEKINSTLPHVTLLLRNMIRGSMSKGEINRGAIINVLPFTNRVWTMQLQGRYILEALQKCLTVNWAPKPFIGPWMPVIAGMNVTLNTTDQSVGPVFVKEGDQFLPLDLDKDYQFTTLHFLAKGGNGFRMIKDHAREVTDIGSDAKVFEKYIKAVSPITPALDNRLTVLS